MPDLQLEVGKTYQARDGRHVEIIGAAEASEYIHSSQREKPTEGIWYASKDKILYTASGERVSPFSTSPYYWKGRIATGFRENDLVEEVSPTIQNEIPVDSTIKQITLILEERDEPLMIVVQQPGRPVTVTSRVETRE